MTSLTAAWRRREALARDDGRERRGDAGARRLLAGGPGRGQRAEAAGVADGFGGGDQLAEPLRRRPLERVAQVEPGEPAAAGGQRVVRRAEGERPAGALGVGGGRALAMRRAPAPAGAAPPGRRARRPRRSAAAPPADRGRGRRRALRSARGAGDVRPDRRPSATARRMRAFGSSRSRACDGGRRAAPPASATASMAASRAASARSGVEAGGDQGVEGARRQVRIGRTADAAAPRPPRRWRRSDPAADRQSIAGRERARRRPAARGRRAAPPGRAGRRPPSAWMTTPSARAPAIARRATAASRAMGAPSTTSWTRAAIDGAGRRGRVTAGSGTGTAAEGNLPARPLE